MSTAKVPQVGISHFPVCSQGKMKGKKKRPDKLNSKNSFSKSPFGKVLYIFTALSVAVSLNSAAFLEYMMLLISGKEKKMH